MIQRKGSVVGGDECESHQPFPLWRKARRALMCHTQSGGIGIARAHKSMPGEDSNGLTHSCMSQNINIKIIITFMRLIFNIDEISFLSCHIIR